MAALAPRRVLAAPERLDPADRGERLFERPRIIAAVVDDRLAVAIGDADPVRHLVRPDHVAPAHFGRLQPQMARDEVDRALHRERRFRPAGAAIGRVRHLVGDDDPARGRQILDFIRAGQMDRGVVGDTRPDRVPGAAIDDILVADRQNPAVIVKPDLDIVPLVARMGGALEMLAPLLDPAHRPPEPAGEKGDQQILGVDMALAAKAAADIERDTPHPRLGQAQQRRSLAAHPMHNLGRGPDRHRLRALVIERDDAAALHRHRGVTVMMKAAFEPVRGAGQDSGGIAAAD